MINSTGRVRAAFLLVLLALSSCLSCSTQSTEPVSQSSTTRPPEPEPSYLRVSNRWIGDYADLMTADGTFIRAYTESDHSIVLGGGRKGIYPGFKEANRGVLGIDQFSDVSDGYNTAFFSLARIAERDDGSTRATVCKWSSNGGRSGTYLFIDYHREGAPPPAAQSGDNARPSVNVFGDWYVVDSSIANSDLGASADCDGTAPVDPVNEGEPPLPPFPGWPAT